MSEHFVIVGAQRCGTTFLHRYLARHPEIEMAEPVQPEPKFFLRDDLDDDTAIDLYRRRFFGRKPRARRLGEKSTSYLEFESVAARLERLLPGVQVVVVLRDPVDRAVSHVSFSQDRGLERRSLGEALCPGGPQPPAWNPDEVSVDPFAYVRRGRYIDYLDAYLRHIERCRIHVLVFEEMISSEAPLLGLLEFLGVDPGLAPDRPEPANAASARELDELPCRDWLVAQYREPNRRLERLLDRRLDRWTGRG